MNTARIAPSRRLFALTTASGLAMSMVLAAPACAQDAVEGEELQADELGR